MQKLLLALAVLMVGVLVPAQSAESPDDVITVTFGTEGDPGSFRAQFHRLGGGLVGLQAMDHWKDVETAARSPHTTGDYMLLAYNGSDHALRLHGGGGAFPADLAQAAWQVAQLPDGSVQFSLDGTGLRFVRTLRHDPKGRGFELELRLENTGADGGGELPLELLGAALTNPTTTSLVGNASFGIAAAADGTTVHVTPKVGAPQPLDLAGKPLSFAGTTSRFFGSFLFPVDEAAGKVLRGYQVDAVPAVDDAVGTHAGQSTRMRYALSLPVPAKGAAPTTVRFGLYLGPKSYRVFETLPQPERFAPVLDVDLTSPCCITIPFGKESAEWLLHLLGWFYDLVHNWGIAIMMLTVLVRGLLAPLNFHMQKSMRAYGSKMAKLKPKMDELKKRHADDPKAYQQAMLAFQREHKIMPPLGGCLPIFLSMPVYIGLFTALRVAYDLRQQPFLFWIHDLSVSDNLVALPFWPHALNLLPIVWIANTAYLTFRQPLPTDPQQRSVQRMMRFMPLMMGVLFYNYASGLMVYMVTSSVWTLVESAITKKILGPIDPNVASMAPTPM